MRHHEGRVRDETKTRRAVNRAWIVCAALAATTHALLLFAIHPETLAQPRSLAEEPSAVELSIVEAAPAAPASAPVTGEPPPEPAPAIPPPPDPAPPPPEPMPEAVPEPRPEPAPPKPTLPTRVRQEAPKPRASSPQRPASPTVAPSSGNVSGALPGAASGRGPSTSARPRYRSNPKPDYPPEARRAAQEGVVMLAVQVTADGRAASVQLSRRKENAPASRCPNAAPFSRRGWREAAPSALAPRGEARFAAVESPTWCNDECTGKCDFRPGH